MTSTALLRTEVHALQLVAATSVEVSAVATSPAPSLRPAAASQTANDTTTPPDFLAFAASILDYLNSLGLGPGPGLAAIGLTGLVVAFAATAYAWNAFADTVNPGLRFLHIPQVPKFPVCFAGQTCSTSAAAQVRIKPANRVVTTPQRSAGASGRSTASSARTTSTATKASGTKKSTSSGTGSSKRVRATAAH